jgi:hypothetical protein
MIHAMARVAPEKAVFRPALPSRLHAGPLPEKTMAKLSYSEQLRHPNWQKKRLECLQRANWCCENCGDKQTTLNVHHKKYVKGRLAWEYELDELAVLCQPCHESEHQEKDLLSTLMSEGGFASTSIAIGLLGGYLNASYNIDPGVAEMARQTDPMFFELGMVAAILEGEPERWRRIIRDYHQKHPNPATASLISSWDELGN